MVSFPTTDINNDSAELRSESKEQEHDDGEKRNLSGAVGDEEETQIIVSNLPDEKQVQTGNEASDEDSVPSL